MKTDRQTYYRQIDRKTEERESKQIDRDMQKHTWRETNRQAETASKR